MATAPTPGQQQRWASASHVLFWKEAVQIQAAGAIAQGVGTLQAQLDMYQFVVALRQLRRAVDLSRKDDRSRIQSALDRYDEALPGAKDTRDVIEHFDEYELGIGKLQKPGKDGTPSKLGYYISEWFYNDGNTAGINLGPYRVDVADALAAAEALADEALEVLGTASDEAEDRWARLRRPPRA